MVFLAIYCITITLNGLIIHRNTFEQNFHLINVSLIREKRSLRRIECTPIFTILPGQHQIGFICNETLLVTALVLKKESSLIYLQKLRYDYHHQIETSKSQNVYSNCQMFFEKGVLNQALINWQSNSLVPVYMVRILSYTRVTIS